MVDELFFVNRPTCMPAARSQGRHAALASQMETVMGQPTTTPSSAYPRRFQFCSSPRICTSSGASAEGGSVVCSIHHKSSHNLRRRAIKDRRGKWRKIPVPVPRASTGTQILEDHGVQEQMTVECRWRMLAAGLTLHTWQREIRHVILLKVALQIKNEVLKGAQAHIKEFEKKHAEDQQEIAENQFEIDSILEDFGIVEDQLGDAQQNVAVLKKKISELQELNEKLVQQHEELQSTQHKREVNQIAMSARSPRVKKKKPAAKSNGAWAEELAANFKVKLREALK